MKKKFTVLIIAAVVFTIATVAMAASDNGITLTPITPSNDAFEPEFDKLAEHMGYDTDEKFAKFHKTAVFMGKYCPDKESFSFVEQMILSGCDPQTTMDIYQFYLTTNEPITIVQQIYDMVYTGEPITNRDVVFENAFNALTNNKCGVLTEEDIIDYIEKGLSVDDIVQANLLSRKAVMTIQEILDARLSGTTWEEIVETVSGETIDSTYNDADSVTLTRAMSIANITDEPINILLSNESTNEYLTQKTKDVNNTLKSKGYWKGRKSENFGLIVKGAEKKGISEAKLTELLDKGYNEIEVFNMIKDPACTAKTIDIITENEVSE